MRIGIYNHYWQAKGGGEKLALVIAEHLSRKHEVVLLGATAPTLNELESYFDLDLSRVQFHSIPVAVPLVHARPAKSRLQRLSQLLSRWQQRRQETSAIRKLGLDFFINISYSSHLACPVKRGLYVCMFPVPVAIFRLTRLEQRLPIFCYDNNGSSYATVLANSKFTEAWIHKRWGAETVLIYPPCDTMALPSDQLRVKQRKILHVGRILRGVAHDKRQDALLEAFKRLDPKVRAGWELVFIGSCLPLPEPQRYLAELREQAQGLPVTFLPDASFDDLKTAYQEAAIYWHATGYGTSAQTHPELQEHFGITTVEAMSAGAVPIVINAGGQSEIVQHGLNGYLWNGLEELITLTSQLMQDDKAREAMSRQASKDSQRFSKQLFCQKIEELIEPMLAL